MRRLAFTMLELITVIVIVAVVTAIMTPAMLGAKRRASIQASLGSLHQMQLATALYIADQGRDGQYGTISEMGLPADLFQVVRELRLPDGIWTSPCGLNRSWAPSGARIQYHYWPEEGPEFAAYSQRFQENTLLFTDMNCDEPGVPLHNRYRTHRGVGVLLGGRLVNRLRPGAITDRLWWSEPIDNQGE